MKPVILDIVGIGPAAAETLAEHNINSPGDLAAISVEQLSAVPGFSEARAVRTISAAIELLAAAGSETPPDAPAKGKAKKEKRRGKNKDKGKGKGKKNKVKDKKKKNKKKDKNKKRKKGKKKKKGKK